MPFVFIALYSCGQDVKKRKPDPNAMRLSNKIIPLVSFLDNADSCRKALSFLDSATAIDSNCFLCFANKIMFLNSLKQHKKAILTNDTLIAMKPGEHDLYLKGGILCEITMDTISSKKYFQQSLTICNSILDTMSKNNSAYITVVSNKAINLIMLDNQNEANEILKNLYNNQPNDPENGNVIKTGILKLMKKSKVQLREDWINSQDSH